MARKPRHARARTLLRVAAWITAIATWSVVGLAFDLPPGRAVHAGLAVHLLPVALVLGWMGWREARVAEVACGTCARPLASGFDFCVACGSDLPANPA